MTDRLKLTVSVLGTGIMGAAMARNLARAGHFVRAWNRTRAKAEPLAADGAHIAETPAEAVRGADVVLTMLYDGAAVREVMREAAPGLRTLRSGGAWVQSTTVGIEAVAELAALAREHGLVFYDSPVLGTRQPAEAGQLTVLGGLKAPHSTRGARHAPPLSASLEREGPPPPHPAKGPSSSSPSLNFVRPGAPPSRAFVRHAEGTHRL